jgi:hypothetical protein
MEDRTTFLPGECSCTVPPEREQRDIEGDQEMERMEQMEQMENRWKTDGADEKQME